jgi:hypothetical protein
VFATATAPPAGAVQHSARVRERKMPAISVLVPTRKRPSLLCRMASSLVQTCASIDNVELLLAFDSDDEGTKQAWESSSQANQINWRCVVMERLGYRGMHIYTNTLATMARGDWLFRFDDDAYVLTNGWDDLVKRQPCDHVVNTCNVNDPEYSSQVFMGALWPRRWFEATGRFSTSQQTDTYVDRLAKTHGRYSLEWVFAIGHVGVDALPSQRIDDDVTAEIQYVNDINDDDIRRDAMIIAGLYS